MAYRNAAMNKVLILDFGSQYTQLIARKVRELSVYSEIQPFNYPLHKIKNDKDIRAIILSGGPASVSAPGAPHCDFEIFQLGLPVLGICYGLQLIAFVLKGEVDRAAQREYGRADLWFEKGEPLFNQLQPPVQVWMSHGDHLTAVPPGFKIIGYTQNSPIGAIANHQKKIYGLQFHPEVYHTAYGKEILANFLYEICRFTADWSTESFIESSVKNIKDKAGKDRVLLGLSGGVDSSVAAVLIHKAIGDQLSCMFIDTGLLRAAEKEEVERVFQEHFHIDLISVTAGSVFLSKLKGVIDPERKRKIIGKTFIEVFEREAKKLGRFRFLAQGTLYPDVIESVSFKGPSATIKSHHNVGGLPEKMKFELLEPLRELFKDEVRAVGRQLELPAEIIDRHPFPGPGLAVRIIGEITENRLEFLRQADTIFMQELRSANLYQKIWQAFAVLLPVQSVGVMGDERTYENVLALRAVTSTDGMTADWFEMPAAVLGRISNRIINEVKGINRVVYDVSSKPPATIEWE
ncbi:MAG: glutamine-hydrolyzing GMP synthase [Caldithrix sp. RBG_13_44_9]|nr:MAG: glutamine-hydrolyzing GMP synthase [Caldithrix sp. RBG_13_44_9]